MISSAVAVQTLERKRSNRDTQCHDLVTVLKKAIQTDDEPDLVTSLSQLLEDTECDESGTRCTVARTTNGVIQMNEAVDLDAEQQDIIIEMRHELTLLSKKNLMLETEIKQKELQFAQEQRMKSVLLASYRSCFGKALELSRQLNDRSFKSIQTAMTDYSTVLERDLRALSQCMKTKMLEILTQTAEKPTVKECDAEKSSEACVPFCLESKQSHLNCGHLETIFKELSSTMKEVAASFLREKKALNAEQENVDMSNRKHIAMECYSCTDCQSNLSDTRLLVRKVEMLLSRVHEAPMKTEHTKVIREVARDRGTNLVHRAAFKDAFSALQLSQPTSDKKDSIKAPKMVEHVEWLIGFRETLTSEEMKLRKKLASQKRVVVKKRRARRNKKTSRSDVLFRVP